jgi:hypothetical protein
MHLNPSARCEDQEKKGGEVVSLRREPRPTGMMSGARTWGRAKSVTRANGDDGDVNRVEDGTPGASTALAVHYG